jgi:perosamine synthetase
MIPYYRLSKNENELEALKAIHMNGNWATGNAISDLEIELKALFNKKHIVLTSNGYSALFIAIRSLGLKGQQIILPAVSTCFAISNAVIATGNTPLFCDVNLSDGNCNLESVTELCSSKNVKHIIAPNHAGNLSGVKKLKELGITVIEDACQSFFSSMHQKSDADMQIFSFYPTKGINGIDGGVIATDDERIAARARKLVYYDDQETFESNERYNFRFLNICGAMALANLKRKEIIVKKLIAIKSAYDTIFSHKEGVSVLENKEHCVAQRYVVFISDTGLKSKIVDQFKASKIALSSFFNWVCPQEEEKKFENANKLMGNTFCIPYFEDLTDEELKTIKKALLSATA